MIKNWIYCLFILILTIGFTIELYAQDPAPSLEAEGNIIRRYDSESFDQDQQETDEAQQEETQEGEDTTSQEISTDREIEVVEEYPYDFENDPYPYQLGLVFGANITTASSDQAGWSAYPNVGVLFDWNFYKYISAFGKVSLLTKSIDYGTSSTGGYVRMQYLQIGLGAKFRYPFTNFAPYFSVGFNLDPLISAEAYSYDSNTYYKPGDVVEPFTMGLTIGPGFTFYTGFGEIFGEFLYTFGFLPSTSKLSSEEVSIINVNKANTHDIYILVGYKFGISELFGSTTQLDTLD